MNYVQIKHTEKSLLAEVQTLINLTNLFSYSK